MIAAIILAAGAAERMGSPKALLPLRGSTFLETILASCEAVGLHRRIVVLGPSTDKALSEDVLGDVLVLRNPDTDSGPLGSLRMAIVSLLNHPVDGALVWHVDQPHVALATIEALLERFRQGHAMIVVPTFGGRRGHPVVFHRDVFPELLAASGPNGARTVVRADSSRVATIAVEDRAVLEDIDTPEAYRELLNRADAVGATPPPRPELPRHGGA